MHELKPWKEICELLLLKSTSLTSKHMLFHLTLNMGTSDLTARKWLKKEYSFSSWELDLIHVIGRYDIGPVTILRSQHCGTTIATKGKNKKVVIICEMGPLAIFIGSLGTKSTKFFFFVS